MRRLADFNKDKLEAAFAHLLAMMLVSGFLGLGTIALLGYVDLRNPTIAGFAGTLLGYVIHQVEHVLRRYFGEYPPIRKP